MSCNLETGTMSTSTPWMERVVSPGFPKVEPPYLTDVELQVVEVTMSITAPSRHYP